MNVGDLKELLKKYPDDLTIMIAHSDRKRMRVWSFAIKDVTPVFNQDGGKPTVAIWYEGFIHWKGVNLYSDVDEVIQLNELLGIDEDKPEPDEDQ